MNKHEGNEQIARMALGEKQLRTQSKVQMNQGKTRNTSNYDQAWPLITNEYKINKLTKYQKKEEGFNDIRHKQLKERYITNSRVNVNYFPCYIVVIWDTCIII